MSDYSIKNMRYRIYQIRKAFKEKKFDFILSNPLNILLFVLLIMRSIVLRLIPRLTKMYFIRKDFVDKPDEINESNYDFKIYTKYTDEIKEFALNRCKENKNYFFDNYSEAIADRFHNDASACALLVKGKIVSIFFTSTQNCMVEQVNYIYAPEENEITISDIYTFIEYRKKGLYSLLLHHSINYYNKNGINTFVMWVMKHNRATIQAQLKLGFSEIFQTVSLFSWLGFEKNKVNSTVKLLKKL